MKMCAQVCNTLAGRASKLKGASSSIGEVIGNIDIGRKSKG